MLTPVRDPASVLSLACGILLLGACASVGPDYATPESPLAPDWYLQEVEDLTTSPSERQSWWELLGDDDLTGIIEDAWRANNTLELAGLRVLEARAQLALASGLPYPQTQVLAGGAAWTEASENAANTAAGDLEFSQFDVGVSASWEIDFWGRYRRQIEAADAAYLGAIAGYDQALILVTAQVALAYLTIRSVEAQLDITHQNIAIQERSLEIVEVQYQNGNTSELDVLQARSLLLGTQSAVPGLEADLARARHSLAVLLGRPPGNLGGLMAAEGAIPAVPGQLAIGLPADLLRQRPDVREAEYVAMAANAAVGLATADLYPSFSLSGTVGLVAAGNTGTTRSGESGFDELFSSDSLSYSVGPSFVWPFFNYGRIRNNIRVQDARLQQALIGYRETVIQAAREVQDAVAEFQGARRREAIMREAVVAAQRASDVALLRFNEGFADYQRVLDAQESLFTQQARLVGSQSDVAAAFVAVYLALGGGWQVHVDDDLIDPETLQTMRERTNWGDLLEGADD